MADTPVTVELPLHLLKVDLPLHYVLDLTGPQSEVVTFGTASLSVEIRADVVERLVGGAGRVNTKELGEEFFRCMLLGALKGFDSVYQHTNFGVDDRPAVPLIQKDK